MSVTRDRIEVSFVVKLTVERDTDEPRSHEQKQNNARNLLEFLAKDIEGRNWGDLKYQLISVENYSELPKEES